MIPDLVLLEERCRPEFYGAPFLGRTYGRIAALDSSKDRTCLIYHSYCRIGYIGQH